LLFLFSNSPNFFTKMAQASTKGSIEVEETVTTSWKNISKGNLNWQVAHFKFVEKKPTLCHLASGDGGLKELVKTLEDNQEKFLAGIFKVVLHGSDKTEYTKFCYFRLATNKVKPTEKAKASSFVDKINATFPVKHISFQLDEDFASQLTPAAVTKELLVRSENITQIIDYYFGPEQTFSPHSKD